MQDKIISRRSNKIRTQETRAKLIAAARFLFLQKGYAETSTPEIVKAAKITRGALYHHFTDKADLFKAVVIEEAKGIAEHIDKTSEKAGSSFEALMLGSQAYFEAMSMQGRARLLLIEGPAVLGLTVMAEIDNQFGGAALREGLENAIGHNNLPLDELTVILSAGFDRAALAVAEGGDVSKYLNVLQALLQSLVQKTN